ncbi:MAG: hypothetical protein GKS00_28920 [Alphaproteobacteria bacterium]|nr:hypothetical protein [Alphaproteobacteria bacterium]
MTAFAATAGEVRTSGFVASELRWFPETPQFQGQFSGAEPSLLLNPEFRYRSDDKRTQAVFIPFLRLSARDDTRTHFDLREAYIATRSGDWDVLVGVNKVFWGVAESRHLVNIINQTDAIEDTDEEDKLGQPMVNVGVEKDWGRVDLFVLPGFRERPFPRTQGRLRAGLVVDDDLATFESGAGNAHIDVAARYSHFIGDWDVGVSVFHGLSREPRFLPSADGTRLAPRYDKITQLGLDLQYTIDAWLWKFEGIVREGHDDPFAAMVGGFEYTFFQVADSDADVGVLAEVHLDGRDENRAPPTIFDNDLFVGTRLALNDVDDTQALAGAVIDAEDGSLSFFLEAERRLGDTWKIEAEARLLGNVDDKNTLAPFKRDSFFNLRLSRFF